MKTTESKNDPFGNNEQEGNPNKPHIEIVKAMKFLNDAGFQVIPNKMVLGEPFGKADELRSDELQKEFRWQETQPCATSSENYWKQRCEAAEELGRYLTYDEENPCNDIHEYNLTHIAWRKLKSQTPTPTGDRDDEWMKENPPFAAPYPKEKRFYIDEVGELLRKYKSEELSISKITELLNEKIK